MGKTLMLRDLVLIQTNVVLANGNASSNTQIDEDEERAMYLLE